MRKGRKHPGYQHTYQGGICQMCGESEPLTFDGMEEAVALHSQAAAVLQAEELTAKLLEPLGNINHRAGEIERESPLFYGKVERTLFEESPAPWQTEYSGDLTGG